jgi:cytochrome c biogenesis protein CcmG/thiol:disulfide interchange protein DsbE
MKRVINGRARFLALVVSAVVAVVAVLATGLGRDPSITASPLIGRPAPAFSLSGLDGPTVRLAGLRGQIVVINFWASWCTECHVEQDALDRTWQQFRDSGVVVVGVDFEDTTAAARDYVHDSGLSYPVVVDSSSRTALAYGIRGIPETFVVDQAGRIAERFIGRVDANTLADRINAMLRAGAR